MKEPAFLSYDEEDNCVSITWTTKDKRLCVYVDEETGVDIFGVSKINGIDIVEFLDFSIAYKWFEEEV